MRIVIEILETKWADANKFKDTIEEFITDMDYVSIDVEE